MIKIKSTMRVAADEITKNGSVITINGTEYDMSDPQPLAVIGKDDDDNDILESELNQRVYKDSEDNTVLFLCYDPPSSKDNPQSKGRAFMFQDTSRKIGGKQFYGSNHLRWFDKDLNKLYDDSELNNLIEWWNAGDEDAMKALLTPTFQMFHMDYTGWKYSGDENHPEQLAEDFAEWTAKEQPTKRVQASEAWFMKGVVE